MSDVIDLTQPIDEETKDEGTFRVNAKGFFLTYAQCALSMEVLLAGLQEIADAKGNLIEKYCICEELHEDDQPHLHAFIKFNNKLNIVNKRYFDIISSSEQQNDDDTVLTVVYHPNVQGCRSENKVIKYIQKGGKYISNIDNLVSVYSEAVELAKKRKVSEAIDLLVHKQARTMVLYHDRVLKNLHSLARSDTKLPRYEFNCMDEFKESVWNNGLTLLLYGKSGYGKTCFAIALFENPILVSHLDQLKNFDENKHDGIIFDDMEFLDLPRCQQIHLVDFEMPRGINVKHSCITIPAKTRKVITTNLHPSKVVLISEPAIRRRIKVVKLQNSLIGLELLPMNLEDIFSVMPEESIENMDFF